MPFPSLVQPIAIVADSWVLPGQLSWEDLVLGRSAVTVLPEGWPVRVGAGCPILPTPPADWSFERFPRGLALAHQALTQLEFDPDRRYGLILAMPNLFSETDYLETVLPGRADPERMKLLLPYSFHFGIAYLARLLGPNTPHLRVDSACASGNDALAAAAQWLRTGFVDDVIVVGASAMLEPVGLALFHNLKALNEHEDLEASCPFDQRRRGFVMGEGAAALWLSNHPPHPPEGYLCGVGQSMSAAHYVEPPEQLDTWLSAARQALQGLERVAYVSAHGTSTRAGDYAETRLLHQLFLKQATQIPISSVKSMLGHCLAASAVIEAIVCLKTLKDQVAPPTQNLKVADPQCDLNFIPLTAQPVQGNFALSNAFGFGGHNACILLAKERP